jgi:hypothetical protein
MTKMWLSMGMPTGPKIEPIDLGDAWSGQGDHPGSVAPHGLAAPSVTGPTS